MNITSNVTGVTDDSTRTNINLVFFVVSIVVTSLVVVANLFIICVVPRIPTLKSPAGWFMIQSAVVDLFEGLFTCLPAIPCAFYNTWMFTDIGCQIFGYLNSITMSLSLNALAVISLDRCLYIIKPFTYATLVTPRRAAIAVFAVWSPSLLIFIIPFFMNDWQGKMGYHYWPGAYLCSFGFETNFDFLMLSLATIFLPGTVIIIVTQIIMFCTARRVLRDNARRYRLAKKVSHAESRTVKSYKAFKVIVTVCIMFTTTWLPKFTYSVVLATMTKYGIPHDNIPPVVEGIVWWLALCNSFANFFIYCFRQTHFKEETEKLCRRLLSFVRPKFKRSDGPNPDRV